MLSHGADIIVIIPVVVEVRLVECILLERLMLFLSLIHISETSHTSGRSSLSEGNFKSVRALNAAKRYMETQSSHPASRSTGSSAASVWRSSRRL